ncbi:MAG TPA: peptidyl-prolyl cis-trans isomerase [Anaeromyxobacteraceae bacterium]|nr:peptidyl-prolyl cis-trans isomerase [Anaeromyxobacteraceae bacterium]
MFRRLAVLGLAALALASCKPSASKKGTPVAKGRDIVITDEEFKARLDEQSPFIRARYNSLERKKEFLDNLIRIEVLAREAERQGLDKDPDVQLTLKKVMVQKLVQKNFQDLEGAKDLPEEELRKYYDEHQNDFFRPKKVRLAAIVLNAAEGTPERAAKREAARRALAQLKLEEKKNTLAFAQMASKVSEDPGSKALAGDLGFKSQAELEASYGPPLAAAAFALQNGQTSGVVETAKGFYIVKLTGQQEELNRPFDQVKNQIANRLYRERKSKEFDEWQKKLRADAGITVDEKVLDAIVVAPSPAAPGPGMPGMPGMPPMPPGHPMGMAPGAPEGARAVPAPAPAPALAPAPPPPAGGAPRNP